jgi:cytochrome c peroxidase
VNRSLVFLLAGGLWSAAVLTAATPPQTAVYSLKSIPVPKPPDLARYVRDEQALGLLGKALFWDMQVSSDNRVACASCHFHAGADHRPQNRVSQEAFRAGARVASAGIFPRQLTSAGESGLPDAGSELTGPEYPNIHGLNVRQIGKRHSPSVINAAYNVRHFWDGRAGDIFTGRTAFGDADTAANVLVNRNGALVRERLRIEQSGLASQAVEPPLDAGEMSYRGRTWPMLGKKLLGARPLAEQQVAPEDSVLGRYANPQGRGLSSPLTYLALVRQAFQPEYWTSPEIVDGFTQPQYNFALFFGLAIQAYESMLISDDTPYDRYLDGKPGALNSLELVGLELFQRRLCSTCHVDPELTLASYRGVFGSPPYAPLGPDAGFFNTGVEPVANDPGLGGKDGFGNYLSATARQRPDMAQWMRGFFKTPSLRNVELTGPYFHTGTKATLEEIIHFYTAGGDYPNTVLRLWGPDPSELISMPAFMKALTDDRVRFERAPFDHPELCVSIGHEEPQGTAVSRAGTVRSAPDRWALVPAVGAQGNRVPLQTFDELLKGVGRDGSRAHALSQPCAIR